MKLLALFQHQIGTHELTYEGDTVGAILRQFLEEYGDKLDEALIDPQTNMLRDYILVLLNGRNINFLNGLETKLSDGDVIAISPPLAGGYSAIHDYG
ncbi:MAG: MoaD family protein [Candidatus Helarchaeota archaeon]